jgi:hypothetical protein
MGKTEGFTRKEELEDYKTAVRSGERIYLEKH